MTYIHKNLADGKWQTFSFFEQMGNIGSEISRAVHWKEKDEKNAKSAFERALELLDLTIEDSKNKKRLAELCRLREALADYFYFENEYNSTGEQWNDYFYNFAYVAAIEREKSFSSPS